MIPSAEASLRSEMTDSVDLLPRSVSADPTGAALGGTGYPDQRFDGVLRFRG